MPAILDAPIPGESLTREPGNAPWEQPSKFSTPEETLAYYIEKFEDEETLDDTLFMFEQKMPISTFVESLTTVGVMNGLHTIDISILISPILHEYFVTLCDTAGIKYVEEDGPTDEEKKKLKEKQRMAVMLNNIIDEDDDMEMPDEGLPMAADIEPPAPAAPPPSEGLVPRRPK